jgi:hypothetical protein
MMTDAEFFAANPNRTLRLREVQPGDPTPVFGDFRPVFAARAGGYREQMKLAALVHQKGTVRLYYIPQQVPLGGDWLLDELAEMLINPPHVFDIRRKVGYDGSWLSAIPCPTLD